MPVQSVEVSKRAGSVVESRILPPKSHKAYNLFDALDQLRKEFPIRQDSLLIAPRFDITKGRYEIPCSRTCGQMHLQAA